MNKNLIRWGAVTSAALVAAGLSLTGAGVAFAFTPDGLTGTLAADLSSTINVDCDAVTSDGTYVYMAAGTTATVNITGTCDGASGLFFMTLDPSEPGDGGITVGGTHTAANSVGSSITAPATMTVDPNTFIQIFKTGGVDSVGIQISAVGDSPNPTGSLGESATLVLSPTASASNVLTTPGTGSYHDLGGDETCELESGEHIYATHTVSVNASGEYTFRVVTTDPLTRDVVAWGDSNLPIDDPFVAVYSTFDPANPDSNVVGCNDDGDNNGTATEYLAGTSATIGHTNLVSYPYPQFVTTLDAGTYTLVLMTRQDQSISDWNEESYPAQSATFELWGPEGAYDLPDTGVALPDTGFATPSWVLPTGLSVVAFGLAIGMVSFVLRRRANS